MPERDRDRAEHAVLTSEVVFARLEELRALLRLTEHLRQFRRVGAPEPPVDAATAKGPATSR